MIFPIMLYMIRAQHLAPRDTICPANDSVNISSFSIISITKGTLKKSFHWTDGYQAVKLFLRL